MFDVKNYINKIRESMTGEHGEEKKKRVMICAGAGIGAVVILSVVLSQTVFRGPAQVGNAGAEGTASPSEASASEALFNEELYEKQLVVDSYQNLGIVEVNGYLNIRETPSTDGDVIGKLGDESACDILSTEGEWYQISSGGLEGYIHSQYVLTGDEAEEKAVDLVKLRAIVTADKLNVRKEPDKNSDLVNQVVQNERYEVLGEDGEWVEISLGYISKEFVTVEYALNEARKLDLKSMVFNLYDNLGISNVSNYLNVRDQPSEKGKIIAKMPSRSAGDILESVDGWYKISSGGITGYVKSDYILTGSPAKDEALKVAELMAIVNTDVLNVRTEPSTDSKIWTQISNSERYAVLKQMDGWVEIELDSTSAYVSTDFVDVRYALGEAIKFSPLEEKSGGSKSGSLRTQIVNYALQFLGNPYVWGGTSLTKGADCSGFTMSVLGHFGIKLPHYSGAQSKAGTGIKSSQLRPGDLIFYSNSGGTINHVAMYIGNGQIVHAANRRSGIKISNYNYRSPARIRNVIGD